MLQKASTAVTSQAVRGSEDDLYSLGTTLSTYGLSCSPANLAMDAKPNAAPRVLLSDAAWFARS